MIQVTTDKKKFIKSTYILKSLKDLEKIKSRVNSSLKVTISVYITLKKVEDCLKLFDMDNEKFLITLVVNKEVAKVLKEISPNLKVDSSNKWNQLEQIISDNKLLIEDDAIKALMFLAQGTYDDYAKIILDLKQLYGDSLVKRKDIYEIFGVDDLVFPRSVFIAYMLGDRTRITKLRKCFEQFDNKLILNSFRNYVNIAIRSKHAYYNNLTNKTMFSTFDDKNIVAMYEALQDSNSIYYTIKKYEDKLKYV